MLEDRGKFKFLNTPVIKIINDFCWMMDVGSWRLQGPLNNLDKNEKIFN
jgi:hypothetical protein